MQAEAYNKRVINALIHSEGIPNWLTFPTPPESSY